MNERHRILLVEDDIQFGNGLVMGLEVQGYYVDWAKDALSAEAALQANSYNFLILDIQLPDRSGLTLLRQLRSKGSDLLVLIVTAQDSIQDRVEGLDQGADDYLVKPFDIDELNARLRAIFRRRNGIDAIELSYGKYSINLATRTVNYGSECHVLAGRDFSVLLLLLESSGRILSRGFIESHLYSIDDDVGSNTVEVYIHNLRKRFGSQLIRTVRGVGYVIDKS